MWSCPVCHATPPSAVEEDVWAALAGNQPTTPKADMGAFWMLGYVVAGLIAVAVYGWFVGWM